jgi:hypothetical protein
MRTGETATAWRRADLGINRQPRAGAPDPRADELEVVVPRYEDRLAARTEPLADRPQDRLRRLHRPLWAPLEQLHDIAEQHEAVDALERGKQPFTRLDHQQHVVAQSRAEMQVRDDEGAHQGPPRYSRPLHLRRQLVATRRQRPGCRSGPAMKF